MTVQYENLVRNPQDQLREIFQHLGVEEEPINLHDVGVPDAPFYKSVFHDELRNPLNTRRIGRWKEKLTEEELREVLPIIQSPMSQLGYL